MTATYPSNVSLLSPGFGLGLGKLIEPVSTELDEKQIEAAEKQIFHIVHPVTIHLAPANFIASLMCEVESLKDGWLGEFSLAPSKRVLENTHVFLNQIPRSYLYQLNEDSLSVTPYGTVTIDWENEKTGDLVSVEIGNEAIGYLTTIDGSFGPFSNSLKLSMYGVPQEILDGFSAIYSKITI